MKKNHSKALLLLLTLPFLMAMYNGPHFYQHNYASYDATYISHELINEDYVYKINIKNNANYYIYSLKLEGTIEEENYSISGNDLSEIFCSYTIGPYVETTVKLTSKKEIPDFNKLNKSGDAYSIIDESIKKHYFDVDTVVESISLKSANPDNARNLFAYRINFKEGTNIKFSCGLFEFVYDDKPVYLMMDYDPNDCCIYTYEELDLTKLKIKNITLFEQYRPFTPTEEGLTRAFLIIIGVLLLIHGALFSIIFFSIRFFKRKNKKAKADLAQ